MRAQVTLTPFRICAYPCRSPTWPPPEPSIGFHAVIARLRQRPESVRAIYLVATRQGCARRAISLRAPKRRAVPVTRRRCRAAARDGGHRASSGCRRGRRFRRAVPHARRSARDAAHEPPLLLVLDGVTDPHNLGACLRSADAFGAHAVIIPKDRAVGVNATVAKAASGAADTVPRDHRHQSRARAARSEGARRLDSRRRCGRREPLRRRCRRSDRLGAGRRRQRAAATDARATATASSAFRSRERVESLNVSVAAGICLYASRRARQRK